MGKPSKKRMKFSRSFIIIMVIMGVMVTGGGYLVMNYWWVPAWVEDDNDLLHGKFVAHLSEVDAVSISLLAYHSPTNQQRFGKLPYWGESGYMVVNEQMLEAKAAIEFCEIWRSIPEQKYRSAGCHAPIYGLRFYRRGRVISEITFCWKCSNLGGVFNGRKFIIDFDDYSPAAKTLWKLMQEYVPLEASAGTNTTSVPQKL